MVRTSSLLSATMALEWSRSAPRPPGPPRGVFNRIWRDAQLALYNLISKYATNYVYLLLF
jgi:hypothetical protein